ncbi:unnamed protein product [Lactuca saligna]|uniref:50S ribosomal protein L18 n=1 Tax=Lactuca saligna TaxID=75948 RepID=A0AA35YFC8_LACSI|nr:unnamed protein product [Lactuca saligna]
MWVWPKTREEAPIPGSLILLFSSLPDGAKKREKDTNDDIVSLTSPLSSVSALVGHSTSAYTLNDAIHSAEEVRTTSLFSISGDNSSRPLHLWPHKTATTSPPFTPSTDDSISGPILNSIFASIILLSTTWVVVTWRFPIPCRRLLAADFHHRIPSHPQHRRPSHTTDTIQSLSMTVLKRYVLRLFMSLKYVTANIVDRNNGRIVATASTVEQSIKTSLECGRTCNAKAATVVGEVLAMRLKVEGLESGQGRGIHVDVNKELEKKDFKNRTKVWAVINSLKNNGVKLILDDTNDTSKPAY